MSVAHDRSRWHVPAILAGMMGLQILLASSGSLWDRDEPRFARAAVEMLDSGNWLVPTFNGELRANKPVLVYWLMAGSIHVFGHSELAVRLPSIVCMGLSALLSHLIARRLLGRRIALIALLIFASMLMPLYIGTAATADAALLAGMLLAVWGLVRIFTSERVRARDVVLLGAGLAWAQLAKGPVGLAVPLIVALGAACVLGLQGIARPRGLWPAVADASLASVVVFLMWFVPADLASGGMLAASSVQDHLVAHVTTAKEGHGGSGFWGYLLLLPAHVGSLVVGTFPWNMQLPAAVGVLLSGRTFAAVGGTSTRHAVARAVLLGWTVGAFLLFSLWATKLPHYILPMLPALAMAMAVMIDARMRGMLSDVQRGSIRAGTWLGVVMAVLLAAALVALAVLLAATPIVWAAAITAPPLLAFAALAVWWQGKEDLRRMVWLSATGVGLLLVLLALVVLPAFEPLKLSRPLAQAVQEAGLGHLPVYTCGYDEPSLIFYLRRPAGDVVQEINADAEALVTWSRGSGAAVLIVDSKRLERVGLTPEALGLRVVYEADVWRYSGRGVRQTVLALHRAGR